MAGLRIGIDVGGTFTHGVVLRPPGEVIASAVTPTTHTHEHGVAAGVRQVLSELLARLDALGMPRGDVELVAHSTTQATNALLEGDVSPVTRVVLVPPGESWLCHNALKGKRLDIGGGHSVPLETEYVPWETVAQASSLQSSNTGKMPVLPEMLAGKMPVLPSMSAGKMPAPPEGGDPIAVIQPLAGGHELREHAAAAAYAATGRAVVCASDITQVLGLAARARTATINASMLPKMLATAEFTARAVDELLPGVPLQVVRSDGGAMSLSEMRRLPVLSLLSGPAAGASAALHRTGLSEVVFLEVGGTSTDITLIKEGRVRHRYATVGGQRLMVPALDLRTVAVGGGSMLRADGSRFGGRSAHIAGLPYLFQALAEGKRVKGLSTWLDAQSGEQYFSAQLSDSSTAALTLTDWYLAQPATNPAGANELLGQQLDGKVLQELQTQFSTGDMSAVLAKALPATWRLITDAVLELARSHGVELVHCTVIGGGGGAPVVLQAIADKLGLHHALVADHTVISAIGAALAVSCVSLSKSVTAPSGADIAALLSEAEARLHAQGAERVSTDYEYDAHRQVLTVTARGSRPYEQSAQPQSAAQLEQLARGFIGAGAQLAWEGSGELLWIDNTAGGEARARRKHSRAACALDRCGRALWVGSMREHIAAAPGGLEAALGTIIEQHTQYTDGGPAMPGLALLCAGRLIPLDQLGAKELIADVLRWENLPANAPGCFLIRG